MKTGLGLPGGTLEKAWTRVGGDDDVEIVLPYYDAWEFSTAPDGDFEDLARRLVPIRAPWSVGRRIIDTSKPRGGMDDLEPDEPGRTQVLKCALFSPAPAPPGSPSEDETWSDDRRQDLVDAIDRPDRVAADAAFDNDDLPRIGPRLYARFQRGQSRVGRFGDFDWFEQLNTSPLPRIVAGLGTRVVQKDQETLMQAAWAQVGEIEKANRALQRMQYARFISEAFQKKHLEPLDLGVLTQLTRRVHGKVKLPGSAFTMAGSISRSIVPSSATDLSYRRALRSRGPLARRLERLGAFGSIVTSRGAFRDFRRTHSEPDGVRGLRDRAIDMLPPDLVARELGVGPREAIDTLRRRLGAPSSRLTVADRFLSPTSQWTRRPSSRVDVGLLAGRRMLEALREALPERPEADPARAESIATLANGLAGVGRG
ncbi:MAG: hypothetical protein KDA28_16270, partial [Phycisphaerales bacterium]|nr:hypothetical protein [Phycisphaerales bacterium]